MESSYVFQTLQARFWVIAAAVAIGASIVPAGATTFVPSQTFKAGTKIQTALDETMNSSMAKYGDKFKLRVIDTAYPALDGAEIIGYVSEVSHAKVSFFLTSIHFRNGTKKPITAYVVNKRVTPYNPMAVSAARRQMAAAPPMPNGTVTPGPVAWQMNFNGSGSPSVSTRPAGMVGGTVYTQGGQPIVVPAGTPVTVELQQDLTIP